MLAASSRSASSPATPLVAANFAQGMPYATLRNRVLGAGWLPWRDEGCWSSTRDEVDTDSGKLCAKLPELQLCNGHQCTMRFANAKAGMTLKVTARGNLQGWNKPADRAGITVDSWRFTPANSSGSTSPCPSADFKTFLQAFASGARVQRAFTAPLVKVAELEDLGEAGYQPQQVWVTAADYRGFNLAYDDAAFHFVDHQGTVDATPVTLTIDDDSPAVRTVSFRYGTSEGNAYRFERSGGCWQLVADTRPPSP